jgi:hypothetical protein
LRSTACLAFFPNIKQQAVSAKKCGPLAKNAINQLGLLNLYYTYIYILLEQNSLSMARQNQNPLKPNAGSQSVYN